jgi:hypothetical protein
MNIFDTAMATALPALQSTFGSAGWTYAPAIGPIRAITPILDRLPPAREGKEIEARGMLLASCHISETDGFPASPNYGGDKLIAPDGSEYFVRKNPNPEADSAGWLTVALRK